MSEFRAPADIGNRALQHLGQRQMNAALGFNEVSKNATEVGFAYGKLRQAELHRNTWRFAIKRQVLRAINYNTMLLAPTLFVPTTTYFRGSIVADQNNTLWISNTQNNTGNDPLTSTQWDLYFGPLAVPLYDSTITYFAGELVYTAPGDGTFNVYQSLTTGNALDPSLPNLWSSATSYYQGQIVQVFPAWASGTTYAAGQTITYTDGNTYSSLVAGNIGNVPSSSSKWALMPFLQLTPTQTSQQSTISVLAPAAVSPIIEYSPYTTYNAGQFVMFDSVMWLSIVANNTGNVPNAAGSTSWAPVTGGTLYMSLVDLNSGNAPATSPTQWTTTFTQGGGNQQWLQIGGAAFPSGVGLLQVNIIYPLGTGPYTDQATANIFRLPANYLRKAPKDPKAGSQTDLGAPTNLQYDDWVFEGDYIISRQFDPIMFRFVADIADVTRMDPMFCEGLAARIASETCETLTQSTAKVEFAVNIYKFIMGEARLVNAIEVGPEEAPMDDWLMVRY